MEKGIWALDIRPADPCIEVLAEKLDCGFHHETVLKHPLAIIIIIE